MPQTLMSTMTHTEVIRLKLELSLLVCMAAASEADGGWSR